MTDATPHENPASTLLAFSNQLADAVESVAPAIVAVNARRRRSSSGVHWRENLIVTADHTIQRDEEITVTLADGNTIAAAIVGRDSTTDLAVLRLEASLAIATIAATQPKVGQLVLAVSRSAEGATSASMGIVSTISNEWRYWHGSRVESLIRPSLMLYPGFSGGALVNPEGQVLGINTSGARHMPLTIPAATVDRVIDQLLQKGRIARGYLGLGMQAVRLPDGLQRSTGHDAGVIIVSVEPGAPADTAGVLIGDILVALNETSIAEVSDVHAALNPEQVGKSIAAKIVRGGSLTEVAIVVGERPGRC